MKNININKFNIGDIVEIIPNADSFSDFFEGKAIYQGQSETNTNCIALEREDGEEGAAQNGWWNFEKKFIKYLQLVKAVKPIKKLIKIPVSANNLKGALIVLKPILPSKAIK